MALSAQMPHAPLRPCCVPVSGSSHRFLKETQKKSPRASLLLMPLPKCPASCGREADRAGGSGHPIRPLLADLGREHRPEPVQPEPHRLVADVDAALEQQVLHVSKRQRVLDVHHHYEPGHLWSWIEPAERIVGLLQTGDLARLNLTPYRPIHLS